MSHRLTPAEEKQISELISKMTLEEKISCCHASSKFATSGVPRLGIPPLTMSDGPHGVREEISADSWETAGWDTDFCTYLPTGTALAATWNRKCARRHGEVLGSEAREREKDVILGPGINMIRQPLCGRNFEYYSEDPCQAGELAAEAIQGIQSKGTACCVKHYALNSQELNRHGVNALCSERTLREMYLPAYEKAVKKGGAMTVMGAYNFFRGQHCCENDYLLNQILKKEWGFDGLVISDWNGVHGTYEAAENGMDLEMGTSKPYSEYYLAAPFRDAVKRGEIDEAVLDDKVRRHLRLMFKLGKLGDRKRPVGERNTPAHQRAAREIGAEAMVLLKNEKSFLPLDPAKVKKVLVVGENATVKHHRGGNSSGVKALYEVSPLEGLQEFCSAKGIELEYIQGYPSRRMPGRSIPATMMGIADAGAGTRGWVCSFFTGRGLPKGGAPVPASSGKTAPGKSSVKSLVRTVPFPEPVFNEATDLIDELKGGDFFVEMDGDFTPDRSGKWHFWLRGASQSSLSIDMVEVISSCRGENDVTGEASIELEAGRTYRMHLRIHDHRDLSMFPVELTCAFGDEGAQAAADSAEVLAAAKEADAVLFFGGISHTDDTESADKPDMKLRGGQNELISAIAKVNPNVAVCLVAGSPVEMPWIGEVPSILLMWYDGMEAGHVVTDILFGAVNPSGKLPFTFPVSYEKSPMGEDADYNDRTCYYKENLFFGYRWYDAKGVRPLFPFGYGLSYTAFRFAEAKASVEGKEVVCSMTVTNEGPRAGAEVVQLYVEPEAVPGIRRPVRELKGFEKIFLAPGESRRVEIRLGDDAFCFYHPVEREWVLRPGRYILCVGNSSDNLPIRLEVTR